MTPCRRCRCRIRRSPRRAVGLVAAAVGRDRATPPALAAAWADPEIAALDARCRTTATGADAAPLDRRGERAPRAGRRARPGDRRRASRPRRSARSGWCSLDADRRFAEVGWWLPRRAPRAGLAAAAVVDLVVDWALAALPVRRLFARVRRDNPALGAGSSAAAGLAPVGRPAAERLELRRSGSARVGGTVDS